MCAMIDKTYVTSWEEYQEVANWVKNNKFTCPNGMVIKPYVYEYNKEDFDGKEIPIMNTSQAVDYFLIKYCPIKLVQDRMREVYGEEYINSILNGTNEYDTFVKPETGTKVKMISCNSPYKRLFKWRNYNNKPTTRASIEVSFNYIGSIYEVLWYNEKYDKFLLPYELGEGYSSCAHLHCKSLKAIIRKIRKWNLPKGCHVRVYGRYYCEEWVFMVR